MSIEAMKLALEALEWDDCYDTSVILQKAAIELLRKAIADAEKQERVYGIRGGLAHDAQIKGKK